MRRKFVINALFVVTAMSVLMLTGCTDMQTMDAPVSNTALNTTETAAPSSPPPPPIVNAKHATLTNLNLNNAGNQITIKPGKLIQASLNYSYNCPNCKRDLSNQIIVGLARRSAQACIYNGGVEGQGIANFELKVPAKPGKYEVRFRVLQAADCKEALRAGWGSEDSPSSETTIGRIIASKKAES